MSFGLVNIGTTFLQAMDIAFYGLIEQRMEWWFTLMTQQFFPENGHTTYAISRRSLSDAASMGYP